MDPIPPPDGSHLPDGSYLPAFTRAMAAFADAPELGAPKRTRVASR